MNLDMSKSWPVQPVMCCIAYVFAVALLVGGMMACSTDVMSVQDPEEAFLQMKLNTYAVTLAPVAPYNTVRLTALGYRGNGSVIPDLVPKFISRTEGLVVNDTGLVTALPESDVIKAPIVVSLTYRGVTRTDTTWISVINTSTPLPLVMFAIATDSALNMNAPEVINVVAVDDGDEDQSFTIPVHFESSDSFVATVKRDGTVTALQPNRSVTLYAKSTVFGVTYTDSLQIRTLWPMVAAFQVPMSLDGVSARFVPEMVVIQKGGVVYFYNGYGILNNSHDIDIVFDTPDQVLAVPPDHPSFFYYIFPTGSGNILKLRYTEGEKASAYQARWFPVAGTYNFRSDRFGAHGTLIVR